MTTKTYQQIQIESTPERALSFLRAIATNQQIRYAMANVGYGKAEQTEGWRHLLDCTGYSDDKLGSDADLAAREATIELDNWDEAGFRRIHAALQRLHPDQDAFVFAGIEASRGPGAVLGVAKILDRLDQLGKGSEPERAAIATLEKRGIDAKLREHLRSLVTIAQAATPMDLPTNVPTEDALQKALEALYAWYRDWSETARVTIRRRDQLILMGLAKRHSRQGDGLDDGELDASPAGQVPAATASVGATSATACTGATSIGGAATASVGATSATACTGAMTAVGNAAV